MLARLSLRTRLVLGVIVLVRGRPRGRRRRDVHVPELVPDPPHRRDARRGAPRRRARALPAGPGAGAAGRGAASTRSRPRLPAPTSRCGSSTAAWSRPGRFRSSRSRRRRRRRGCPRRSRCPARARTAATASRYFTVSAQSGGDRYRVRASIEPQASNYLLIIATSLSGVDSTLHRLLLIELLVTAAVLVALAVLGLWVVRLGLRPLAEIEQTAGAIAAGDLSRRVERADERTEVGRLGLALNAMLEPDRVGVPGARGLGAQAPALRRRRLPRAAHAAHGRARVRGAVRPRRGHAARRSRPRDDRDQPRVGADEPARRRPAAPRAARRGPAARAEGRRARARGRRRRRDRAHRGARPSDRVPRRARRRGRRPATGSGSSSTTCSATSAPTRRRERRSR